MSEEEPEFDTIVYEALAAAKKAFQATISDYYCDPAFCDIKFTAYIKDCNFDERLRRIEIEDECIK